MSSPAKKTPKKAKSKSPSRTRQRKSPAKTTSQRSTRDAMLLAADAAEKQGLPNRAKKVRLQVKQADKIYAADPSRGWLAAFMDAVEKDARNLMMEAVDSLNELNETSLARQLMDYIQKADNLYAKKKPHGTWAAAFDSLGSKERDKLLIEVQNITRNEDF